MATKLIIALFALLYPFLAQAEYQPSITVEKYIKTITINADGTSTETLEEIDKIETLKGVQNSSQNDLTYTQGMQTLDIIDAYTINPAGKKIKVTKENIRLQDDSANTSADTFSDSKHKIIIYPEVTVGSKLYSKIRTYNYKTRFKNHYASMQLTSPFFKDLDTEINLIVNKKLPLYIDNNGYTGGLVSETKDSLIYQFKYSQNEALATEDGMISTFDFSPYLAISSFKNYQEISQAYQKIAYPKTNPSVYIKSIANMVVAKNGEGDKRAEAKALYEWVLNNIRYVAVYIGNGGIEPHDADTVIKNKFGDCKDHVVLYEALLRARGISSSPALINSGKAYKLPKYPTIAPLNHVITYLPDFDLYVDTTSSDTPFGMIPYSVLGKPTVLTALDQLGQTPSIKTENNSLVTQVAMEMLDDGHIKGKAEMIFQDQLELTYRDNRISQIGQNEENTIRDILSSYEESGAGEINNTDPHDLDVPYQENTTFLLDPKSNIPGPAALTMPIGLSQNKIYQTAINKPLTKRNFPYQCWGRVYKTHYELTLPSNVKITKIPEDLDFHLDEYKFSAKHKRIENKIISDKELVIDYKNMVCDPEQEQKKKEFFKVLQKDLRSQIFYE
jgi:hypothetical protein